MDGLALCCNLFADGPLTLRRLRSAGVASLAELERVPDEILADWLCASAPQARAFAAEARRLARRIGDGTFAEVPARETPRAPVSFEVPRPVEPAPPPPPPPRAPAPAALRPGLVPGLDAAACERLTSAGVRTLQALSESAGLSLARRTGIPYSTLLFLARGARRVASSMDVRPAVSNAAPERADAPLAIEPPLTTRERVRPDAVRTDEFTLPLEDPGSAGPFR